MAVNFNDVAQLANQKIAKGEKWIYIADFNVKHKGAELKSTDRVDSEMEDAKQIIAAGGNVLFLAHKGRFKDNDTEDLDYLTPYLAKKLGCEVTYCKENNTPAAVDFVKALKPGTAAIMGNTRKHQGEEKNDAALAEQFAKLGQKVAVGGFGKAHRAHASNAGILAFIPGFATRSQLAEMRQLAPWAGKGTGAVSVAVLGGVKKEKITTGLSGFAGTYDVIIPGGIVLNTVLKVKGYAIGASLIADEGKTFEKDVQKVMASPNGAKVVIPAKVIVAKSQDGKFTDVKEVAVTAGVPDGYMIVDYIIPEAGLKALDRLVTEKGRLILAGTPGIYTAGFKLATEAVVERMKKNKANCVVLGGDTAAEVKFDGPMSTGGGSALHFVAYGTTPVYDALVVNKKKFNLSARK